MSNTRRTKVIFYLIEVKHMPRRLKSNWEHIYSKFFVQANKWKWHKIIRTNNIKATYVENDDFSHLQRNLFIMRQLYFWASQHVFSSIHCISSGESFHAACLKLSIKWMPLGANVEKSHSNSIQWPFAIRKDLMKRRTMS